MISIGTLLLSRHTFSRPALWLWPVMALALLLYWQGVDGPLLFDDYSNLAPIKVWLAGELGWIEVAFGNQSGLLGRSVSMLSLMLNAAIGGTEATSYKVGNIIVHLTCGGLVFLLAREILGLDARSREHRALGALLIASIWLLHPAMVSTVLYAVQRMAQVSTFFVLASLIVFVRSMAKWELQPAKARWMMFLAFPLIVLVGAFGKENALVAPLMALGIAAAFPASDFGRSAVFRWAFWTTLVLGVAGFLYILVERPAFVVGTYELRDFTLEQRLYTQLIALVDYARYSVMPAGGISGLFADDYPVSSGLLAPPRTLLSLAILMGTSIGALALRSRAPLVLAGWLMFLAGHAMESSVFPLELYFEHRNYLPSVGIYIACWGLLCMLIAWIRTEMPHLKGVLWLLLAAYGLIVVFATAQRAAIWNNELVLFAVTSQARPDSYRANAGLWDVAIRNEQYELAGAAVERMIASRFDRPRALGHIHRVVLDCMTKGAGAPSDLELAVSNFPSRLIFHDTYITKELIHTVVQRCSVPSPMQIGEAIEAIVAKEAGQTMTLSFSHLFDSLAAQAFWQAGEREKSIALARSAWTSSGQVETGMVYARILAAAGRYADARSTVHTIETRLAGVRHDLPLEALKAEIDTVEAQSRARDRQEP